MLGGDAIIPGEVVTGRECNDDTDHAILHRMKNGSQLHWRLLIQRIQERTISSSASATTTSSPKMAT